MELLQEVFLVCLNKNVLNLKNMDMKKLSMKQLCYRLIFIFIFTFFIWFLFDIFYKNIEEFYSIEKLKEILYYSFIKAFLLVLFLGILNYFDF